MGCIKWYVWKVWAYNNSIEYEDNRAKHKAVSTVTDLDGTYVFYIRTLSCNPVWYGPIKKVAYMGRV